MTIAYLYSLEKSILYLMNVRINGIFWNDPARESAQEYVQKGLHIQN